MALIAKAAFENQTLSQIASTVSYDFPATASVPTVRKLTMGHKMVNPANGEYYQGIVGGKTGYTSLAGNTLGTCAERDGKRPVSYTHLDVYKRQQEVLTNVRVVKSFVREDYECKKFKEMNADLKESSLKAMRIVIATMPVMMRAMNVTTVAVVWYGGNIIIGGGMAVGDLTAFTTYIVQILMSLMMLSMVFLQSSRAMASVKRINEVMDTEIDLTDTDAARKDAHEMCIRDRCILMRQIYIGYGIK